MLAPGSVFDVRQLEIRISRRTSNAAQAPWQLRLSGAGGSSYSRGGRTWRLPAAGKEAVALLNELYTIHFFELPAQYATRDVARLRDDGSVVVLQNHDSAGNLNSVCVTIAESEKCVRYGSRVAPELDRIVEREFAAAERHAD